MKTYSSKLLLIQKILFPVLLVLFPLIKINQGIDWTDTGYSLGNYRFFSSMDGTWVLATYLSGVTGHLLTLLPLGETMLGMKLYTSLVVGAAALVGYRFFITKMPAWIAFLGEMAAIGLCWCPTVILYNYMSYFFFLLGATLLFRGLAGERRICLFLAGVCLGLNVFVRMPNVLEAGLILCVWYYGYIRHKEVKQVMQETFWCIGGYGAALLLMLAVIIMQYGTGAPGAMVSGIFGMAGSAEDYTFGQMLYAIWDAYRHGLRWLVYMVLCVIPGIPFLMIRPERFPRLRQVVYCVCIVFLFIILGRWGMYNFRYYQKEAALQWAVIFLILSLGMMIRMLFSKAVDVHWKLIASMGIIFILITPLGSNNHVWPIINNLFFVAPVTFWMFYKFIRWGKTYIGTEGTQVPLFPAKAMTAAVILALLVQSIGVGGFYVFLDGENGQRREARISENQVTRGMYTTQDNYAALEEISIFFRESHKLAEKKLILFGDIPGLCYYLDREPAIFTTWPDLDTSSIGQLQADLAEWSRKMAETDNRPAVIWGRQAWEDGQETEKEVLLREFMAENTYIEIFNNAEFVIFI